MKSKFDELVSCFNRKVSGMEIDQKYKTELLGMITAVGIAHRKEQLEIIHCRNCRYWKRGKWEIYVISMFDGEGCRCSECGLEGVPYWDFCPNCGADMRGEQDDESRSNSNAQTDTRARGMGATDKSSGI